MPASILTKGSVQSRSAPCRITQFYLANDHDRRQRPLPESLEGVVIHTRGDFPARVIALIPNERVSSGRKLLVNLNVT